jgi:hypothetical protein
LLFRELEIDHDLERLLGGARVTLAAFCLVVVFGRNRSATSFLRAPFFTLEIAAHSSCTEDPTDDHADEKHTWDEDDVLDGGHARAIS